MELEEILKNEQYVKFEEVYNDAILGVTKDERVIYDYDLMVECLMEKENMDGEEASDYIDYQYSFGGYPQPIILYRVIEADTEQNCYNMLREFYYEKNGLDTTIDFLKYMINELEIIKDEQVRD